MQQFFNNTGFNDSCCRFLRRLVLHLYVGEYEEEYHAEFVVPTVKHGGTIWIAASEVREMFICERRMNTDRYISALEIKLRQSYARIFGEGDIDGIIFQQNNAPCYKSKKTLRWMSENRIQLMDWPAQLPNLN